MDLLQHTQVAVALIQRGDCILLVQQQGATDRGLTWALPGGVIELGELPTDAMIREVCEETGLQVVDPGRLLYVVSSVDPTDGTAGTVFVFAVSEWRGDLRSSSPDDPVCDAQFVSREDAIERLQQLPWTKMREPIVSHLSGEVSPGALWLYHDQPDGTAVLVGRLAEAQSDTR